jgi:phospholipase C
MKLGSRRSLAVGASVALIALGATGAGLALTTGVADAQLQHANLVISKTANAPTTTPIKHVVVIFDENVSFDHYFATYPNATNTSGEPFYAAPGTPTVNGLTGTALTTNPNGQNPERLDPSNVNDVLTCDQNHDYTPEQNAFDGGRLTGPPRWAGPARPSSPVFRAPSWIITTATRLPPSGTTRSISP